MFRFCLVLVTLVLGHALLAQQSVFTGTPITQHAKTTGLDTEFKTYHLFEIDSRALDNFVKQNSKEISFSLQLGTTFNWNIQLFPHDIRTADYQLQVATENGIVKLPRGENKTFRGHFANAAGEVRLTLDEGFINGYFQKGKDRYFIELANRFDPELASDVFVVYHEKDVIPKENNKCTAISVEKFTKPHLPELDDEKMVGECYTVEIAIASDFSMYNQFGSVAGTESATLAILNNVQTNFDDDFDDEIQFQVTTQFVSSCFGCDPAVWTNTTDPFTLLPNFRTWGNSGGFGGANFDVASLWTNRNFDGETIGLAYVGVLCSNSRYNILEHYTNNASLLRVLQAHEFGHNFDADHTGFNNNSTIMAPFINNTNEWAPISMTEISNYIAAVAFAGNCFSDCSAVGQPPLAGFGANQQIGCAPMTVNFQDQSFGTVESYQWSFPGGNPATSTQQNPVVVYNTPGVYDVSLEVSNSAGSNSLFQPGYITVQSPAVPNFIYTVDGTTVTFVNQSTNADNQIWDFGDGNTSLEENPTYDFGMDGIYNVTLTASNVCGPMTFTQQIVIITPPIAGFTADQTDGCVPLQVQFSNQSSANSGNFSWVFEGGTPATSNQENPLVTFAQAGSFDVTLTVSNAAGQNMASETGYITVGPLPTPDFSFTNIDGELEVDFTNNSTDATTYSWDFGDGSFSTNENPNHSYNAGGEYTVTLTATNSCGSETTSQTVSLLIAPTAGFSVENTSGCAPFEVQFSDQSSGNATAWNWTFEGGTPATSTEQNPTVTYNTPGIYDVSLTVSNSAGENTLSQTDYIEVGQAPEAGFTSDYTLGNTSAGFTNTSQNANSYNWDFGDGESSTEENPSHDFGADGEYLVSLTVSNECGSDTFTETITVVTAPDAGFEAETTGGCLPLEIQFNDLSSDNVSTWNWTFEGGTPGSSSEQNPSVTYETAGVYTVTLEVSNAAGTDVSTFNDYITITDVPTADFSASSQDLTVDFTNNSSGATSYHWDFGDGMESELENPEHQYAADGIYTVTLTATNDCGSVTTTQEITVGGIPSAGFSSDQLSGCIPLTISFTDESSTNANSWEWTFEGGNPSSSNEQNPAVTYNTPGVYDVMLIASNDLGSDTITQEDFIQIDEGPLATFEASVDELDVAFTNNSENATSYNWDFGDDSGSDEVSPNHSYAEDGTYVVTLIATNACGSDTSVQTLVIATPPAAGFSTDTNGGCAPVEVQFTDESSSNVEEWLWTFEGGNPATSTEQNPVVLYQNYGIFNVSLVVSNSAGESTLVQEDLITIEPQPEADFSFSVDGFTVDFTDASNFGDTYEWSFGDGETSDEQNPTHSYAEDGTYEVTLKITNECGENTIVKTVNILTPPVPAFSSDLVSGCAPFTVQFFNESSANTSSVKWTFEGGIPAQTTQENPVVLFENPGTYDVTLTAINDLGEVDLTLENYIAVNDEPDAGFNFDVSGFEVFFLDNSTDALSYAWDFGDGTGSDEANPVHLYEEEGIFTVVLVVENECGTDTTSSEILIDADLPIAGFSADQTTACAPMIVQYTNESSDNAISYTWTFEGGEPATSTEQNPQVTYAFPGVYTVTLIATNGAGSDALTRFDYIRVGGEPVAEFGFTQDGFTVEFINVSTAADNFIWNFGDGGMSTDENPIYTFEPGLSYPVQLIVINECGTDTTEQVINFEGEAPEPFISADQTMGCTPFTVAFADMSAGEPTEWFWQFEGGEPATSTEENPTVTYNDAGTFEVSLQVSNVFGTMSQVFASYITVNSMPEAEFDFNTEGLEVSFEDLSTGGNITHNWAFGDGNESQDKNPVHLYESPGLYEVQLAIKNDCGADTFSVEINLIIDDVAEVSWLEGIALFPNPNNGNFTVELRGLPAEALEFRIFNVLGQQFYQASDNFSAGFLRKNFEVEYLTAGLYLLEIRSGNAGYYRKIVIE